MCPAQQACGIHLDSDDAEQAPVEPRTPAQTGDVATFIRLAMLSFLGCVFPAALLTRGMFGG